MQARYYPWAVLGGLAVTLAPGTPLWLLALAGAAAHMTYDIDPEGWRETGQRLLTAADRVPWDRLPSPRRLLGDRGDDLADGAAPAPLAWPAPTSPAPAGRSAAAPSAPPAVAIAERDPLLSTLDNEPHQLVIGRSRGGKTSLIHELATSWAAEGQRVVVCDPDMLPGMWPGCRAVGGGDDLAAMKAVLDITAAEVERRRKLRAAGQRTFKPLHLVIDEAQDVLPAIDGGLELFEDIARRGAKLGIFMTVGVQDRQKDTLKLEGKTHLLKNLVQVEVMKGHDGQRVAVIADPVDGKKIKYPIPQLRDPESLVAQRPAPAAPAPAPAAPPVPARTPVENPDSILGALLGEAVPAGTAEPTDTRAAESHGTGSDTSTEHNSGIGTTVVKAGDGVITIHNTVIAPEARRKRPSGPRVKLGAMAHRRDRYQQVKALVQEGMSATKIRQQLKLNQGVAQALVRQAKAELGKS